MTTPGNTPTPTAPATVGNQPTETVSGLHRLLNDVRVAAAGLNGDIQREFLDLVDAAKTKLETLFHQNVVTPSTTTITAPQTPQVAEPGSEAHAQGLEAAQAAQQAAVHGEEPASEQASSEAHAD